MIREGLMVHLRATDAKNQFGYLLDTAQREAVLIEKNGRSVAVVLSDEEYKRLLQAEDNLWALKAQLAKTKEFYSETESEGILDDFLNA